MIRTNAVAQACWCWCRIGRLRVLEDRQRHRLHRVGRVPVDDLAGDGAREEERRRLTRCARDRERRTGEDPSEAGRQDHANHGLPLGDAQRVARLTEVIRARGARTSIVERATSGSMMIDSANPPAMALWWWPQPRIGSGASTTIVKTKMPITIDGKPFSTSSQSLICRPIRSAANSLDVESSQHAEGQRDHRRDRDEHQRAGDRRRDASTRLTELRRPLHEEVEVQRADAADEDRPDDERKRSDGQRRSKHRRAFGDLVHQQPAARATGGLEAQGRLRHQPPPARFTSKRLTMRCAA